ncbi:MAG: TIGR03560 family F420-dependent LLM class oxidoreductase [Actinomycetota bacterium]|nr:TIGR03560 family F420-dependent LLM class oxidoreductase [Actinomycetota bacterium]
MRIALSTSPQRCSWDWLLEVWQRADQIEMFESAWTFDHFYPLFGDTSDDCLEGWISLTALLTATDRIRGGVLVTGMLYRHPAVLANMASTLDIASGGRLELGLGAGWFDEECEAYGIDLGTMEDRFGRFTEGLEVIHGLLTGERTSFKGRHYRLEDAMNNPKGPQDPLPICIGGSGLQRTIPMAARYAHHWNYGRPTMSVDDFARRHDVFQAALEAEGRDRDDVTVSTIIRADGDLRELRTEAEAYEAAGADLAIVSVSKSRPPSHVEELGEILRPLVDQVAG